MDTKISQSLQLAEKLLDQDVTVTIDRKLGSKHPKHGFIYEVNYGYIKGVLAPDGEELDAYVLNISEPLDSFNGYVAAIVHRLDNDDDKLVVILAGSTISDEQIEYQVKFQEQWFKHAIIRKSTATT
jgi:inorganic pyrophosphatase